MRWNLAAWCSTRQQGAGAQQLCAGARRSAQSLLTRAVTLGRLQTVSEGLSGGRQLLGNCRPLTLTRRLGWLTRPNS
ncbi:UNVERIFIED_CONTAM: hypothetical protein Sradi_6150600 [Sesamum radiatum]|uniref:Uncharacterized protein n=1 Tax=Sesamum radiatum TaxID=300843 RepID=A0AAW2KLK5_SESRA